MALKKNDKGLTLIELLITIAVIAIVAAISVPVITNVIDSARDNSAGSMEAQVNAFIDKYTESGEVSFDGTDEFTAWVDLDGDGVFSSPAEVIETFTVDTTQFAVTITGTNAAPTGATVTAAGANNAGGNNNGSVILQTTASVHYDWDNGGWFLQISELGVIQNGDTVIVVTEPVDAGSMVDISGTYTDVSVTTINTQVGYDQELNQPIYGDRVQIRDSGAFSAAFGDTPFFYASSWGNGVSISVTR